MAIVSVNARNQFKGRIREIVEGPVISEIDVQADGVIITATITTRSVKQLKLAVGSEVLALIKSSDVMIATLRHPTAGEPS
ncbi:molybdopterin-binding protein [uncultured Thiodictyon sp.]|uniref:TOBE domain-containing protein n=1 Tax=uncultured Thiodictyon sp. TaxID=1846217 RepID=UPI0025EA1D2A|nr:molybdopterin-binding protein [uncultured Thiodictyon sp.]